MPKPKKSQQPVPQGGEIILYQTEDGQTRIQCRFEDKAIWLTQKLMGELFQKDIRTINEHLQNIYEEAELDPAATIRKFRIVQAEGSRQVERLVDHYHLNANPQLGYEILLNKYFYRYHLPTSAKELLAEFWKLEKGAGKMLEGLAR